MLFLGIPYSGMFVAPSKYPNSQISKSLANLAIWLHAMNMAKWGIPEKSIKNVTQRRWPQVCRTLQSKIIARKQLLEIPSAISPAGLLQFNSSAPWPLWVSQLYPDMRNQLKLCFFVLFERNDCDEKKKKAQQKVERETKLLKVV